MYKKRVAMDQSNGIADGKLSKVGNFREISASRILFQIVASKMKKLKNTNISFLRRLCRGNAD